MANFTINSLSESKPLGTDKFIKSDSNGVLTSVTFDGLKNELLSDKQIINVTLPSGTANGTSVNLTSNPFTLTKTSTVLVIATVPLQVVSGTVGYFEVSVSDNGPMLSIKSKSTTGDKNTSFAAAQLQPGSYNLKTSLAVTDGSVVKLDNSYNNGGKVLLLVL